MSTYTALTSEDMETMEKVELMEKITELQDLMKALMMEKSVATPVSAPEATPVSAPKEEEYNGPRRITRSVKIEGGRTVMGYVLGHKFTNLTGIRKQVIKVLGENGKKPITNEKTGKTGYGIYIKNNDDLTLTLWSYYEFGLDWMEEQFISLMREGQERVRNGTLRRREHRPQEHHHTSTYSSHPEICRYRELRARRAMRNPDVSKNPQHYTYTINGGYRRKHHH